MESLSELKRRGQAMNKAILSLVVAMLLVGCALGPDYKRPAIDAPQAWRVEQNEAQETANTAWWHQFDDPVLDGLIDAALKQNYDLRIATARVDEFVGRYWVGRSGLFPQIGANALAGQNRVSEEGMSPLLSSALKNPADSYRANFTGSWEIDIWGKLRRATEASKADLLSTEEARQAVILSLVSAVANSYINLRDLDKQLEVTRRTAKVREDSYKLFKLRYEGGVISELELNQVKSEYEQALATIPQIEKQIAFQENALSLLIGRNPGPITRGKGLDALVLPAVPAGLPSDLLAKRPDIRQAEQALVAANARIGVAKAQFFPTISLTGLFGWASADLSSLFTGPAQVWSWGGALAAPIFTGGSLTGQLRATEAIQQQALFNYQAVIQTAFREVEDSLADQKRTREQMEAQKRQVDSLKEYARIANLRYENGYTSYIEVLDAERSLFSAELGYAQTQGVLFQALVNLYKTMGGGWVVEADNLTAAATPPEGAVEKSEGR
jgi:multidrug efflux system outer membrane protein